MALPLAPIAAVALRYGTVALITYAATRQFHSGHRDQRAEDALDDTPEGLTWHRQDEQINASTRYTRTFRLGTTGPAVEVDYTSLHRLRIKRL